MVQFPPPPPDSLHAAATVPLRYEDVCQDGRAVLEMLPNALGATVWEAQIARDPRMVACLERGIIPILTRFVLTATRGPFSATVPMEARGTFEVARVDGPDGEVDRLVLDMWAELAAPIARTHAPRPAPDAPTALAGRVFAEHVFTRPFAPPGERKVKRLDLPGGPDVPRARYAPSPLAHVAQVPAGARAIDPAWWVDPTEIVLGLRHTDSNAHVNSLVYLRLFEEAALRRIAALGRPTALLARALEIGYRKPCFAGERMRVAVRAFEASEGMGVIGVLVEQGEAVESAKPRAFVRMILEP